MTTLSGKPASTDAELRNAFGEAMLGIATLVGLFLFVLGLCGLCDRLNRSDRPDRPDSPGPHTAARPEARR